MNLYIGDFLFYKNILQFYNLYFDKTINSKLFLIKYLYYVYQLGNFINFFLYIFIWYCIVLLIIYPFRFAVSGPIGKLILKYLNIIKNCILDSSQMAIIQVKLKIYILYLYNGLSLSSNYNIIVEYNVPHPVFMLEKNFDFNYSS